MLCDVGGAKDMSQRGFAVRTVNEAIRRTLERANGLLTQQDATTKGAAAERGRITLNPRHCAALDRHQRRAQLAA